MSDAEGAVLEARDVGFSYGARAVLRNISFKLNAGEALGIVGPNGAGKSTLVSLCCGARRAETGAILYRGRPVESLLQSGGQAEIAVVPQQPIVPEDFTVFEVVMLGRYPFLKGLLRRESREDERIAREALAEVGLADFECRLMGQLSGGERRLVTLARALAQQPKLLILDEPDASLDLARRQQFFRRLEDARRQRGLTTLTITHDVGLAGVFCDRLILLKDGAIFREGSPTELLTEQVLGSLFDAEVWAVHRADGSVAVGLQK